ncbi:MAG: 3-oxoacyl-ACP reductase FabG [Sandaracinaceae bacterium]|nr:3-oxoacyl-ACP reductase FabG [Sandaracinaceae bacterium]
MIFFVTGGSRGIGEAIVLDALREGHDVAFTYRENRAAAERVLARAKDLAPGRRCLAYALDVRDSSAVESVADRVLDDLGDVHVVVPNAGIAINALAVNMSDEDWREVLDTNLTGAFYVVRQFLPTLIANRFGRIVLVSSMGRGGVSGQAAYAASKAGLVGLGRTLAKEYGKRGITTNTIVPGFIETDMTVERMSEDNRKFWLEYCPLERLGELSEVSKVVLFLASDGAGFINGHAIDITGGLEWAP